MSKLNFTILFFFSVLLFGCLKTEFDGKELTQGSANFTKYVAVGNSLTQGYQDGGMHNELGQQNNSYPAIIAGQLKLLNPSLNFLQPTVPSNGSGYIHLEYRNGEIEVIKAYDADAAYNDPAAIDADPEWGNWGDTTVQYNNLAVSGIKLANCLSGGRNTTINYNLLQLLFNENARFLNFGDANHPITYLDHIKKSNATFFTSWLGNNDVLGWSTSGGDDSPNSSVPGLELTQLTDLDEFEAKYDSVLTAFSNMGAKGVCATIPDVTSIPYFNTVTLEEIGRDVWIKQGPYSGNPGNVRKATNEDLILLTAIDSLDVGAGESASRPLGHTFVLDKDEKIIAQNRSVGFNIKIKNLAAKHGFAVADMYQFMGELKSGLIFDGVDFDARFIEGGAFSLDGVHPNGRGYAIIANKFIETINEFYGSNIPTVSVGNYRGIKFP